MTHYEVLGISSLATQDEVRTAYRRLAMKHHPDRVGGDAQKFDQVKRAYEALQNRVCPLCEGKGHIRERNGAFTKQVNCPHCWNLTK